MLHPSSRGLCLFVSFAIVEGGGCLPVKKENDLWTSWMFRPSWFEASQPIMNMITAKA